MVGNKFIYSLCTSKKNFKNEIQRVKYALENLTDYESTCDDVFFLKIKIFRDLKILLQDKNKKQYSFSNFVTKEDLTSLFKKYDASETKNCIFEKIVKGKFVFLIFLEKFSKKSNLPTKFLENVLDDNQESFENSDYVQNNFSISPDFFLVKNVDVILKKKHVDDNLDEFYKIVDLEEKFLKKKNLYHKNYICFFSEFQKKSKILSNKSHKYTPSSSAKKSNKYNKNDDYEILISSMLSEKFYYVINNLSHVPYPDSFILKKYN
ncbi:hypothetical protein GVAV_001034 [Gurleya vavrai]